MQPLLGHALQTHFSTCYILQAPPRIGTTIGRDYTARFCGSCGLGDLETS